MNINCATQNLGRDWLIIVKSVAWQPSRISKPIYVPLFSLQLKNQYLTEFFGVPVGVISQMVLPINYDFLIDILVAISLCGTTLHHPSSIIID